MLRRAVSSVLVAVALVAFVGVMKTQLANGEDSKSLVSILDSGEQIKVASGMYDGWKYRSLNDFFVINDLDVFSYYRWSGSPLQKDMYKSTDEYKERLQKLKDIKKEWVEQLRYIEVSIGNYDVKRSAYPVEFSADYSDCDHDTLPPKAKSGFLFKSLPLVQETRKGKIVSGGKEVKGLHKYTFWLPLPKEEAVVIESNYRNSTDWPRVYLVFSHPHAETITYGHTCIGPYESPLRKLTERMFVVDKVRVILGSRSVDKVFFDRTY